MADKNTIPWSSILYQAKPSRAISEESDRQGIDHGHIRHEDGGSFLYCTDSWLLVRIPIRMDCRDSERESILPEVSITAEGLKALDAGSRFRVVDGFLQLDNCEARYPVVFGLKGPPFDEIMKRTADMVKEGGEVTPAARITFNPELLSRLVEALGLAMAGVSIENVGPNKALTVKSHKADLGVGLLMPFETSAEVSDESLRESADQVGRGSP